MKTKVFFFAVAAAVLTSCSSDEVSDNESNVINLSAQVSGTTRATATEELQNTQFVAGKTIHVDVFETGQTTPYTNGDYTTTDGAGGMSGNLVYPASKQNIDIEAYYPSTVTYSATTFTVSATQQTAAQYQGCDLMYAKLQNQPKKEEHQLTFSHALSKVIVNLLAGNGVSASDITSKVTAVTLNGSKLTANINKGVVSSASGSTSSIDVTGSNVLSNVGIIVPQTITSGTAFISVTYGGQTYTYSLSSDKVFAAGKQYTYTLTLNAGGISLKSQTITDWVSETGGSGTITI